MFSFVLGGLSVGVEFHLYRGFKVHFYRVFGVCRYALEFGALTLDVVKA